MSVAGTVYATIDGTKPVRGARVSITDATGRTVEAETNCAGTFYLEPKSFAPAFPIKTTVSFGAQKQTMITSIHREASCAACHQKAISQSSPGPVFLFKDNPPADLPGGCP